MSPTKMDGTGTAQDTTRTARDRVRAYLERRAGEQVYPKDIAGGCRLALGTVTPILGAFKARGWLVRGARRRLRPGGPLMAPVLWTGPFDPAGVGASVVTHADVQMTPEGIAAMSRANAAAIVRRIHARQGTAPMGRVADVLGILTP